MTSHRKWWSSFAPYWEHLEHRHLSPLVADELMAHIHGPCLVVGAGQGLVVEHLQKRGVAVFGLDLERAMLKEGRRRRGVDGVQGDARHLPFADSRFATVIVASGVVDHIADGATVAAVLTECRRVLSPGGALLVAFYKLPDEVRRVCETLGVLDGDVYRFKRLFEIQGSAVRDPLGCVRKIASWTGKSRARAFLSFAKLGAYRPRAVRSDAARISAVFKKAAADGVSVSELLAHVPDEIPYRDADAARALLGQLGFSPLESHEHTDCLVYRLGKRSSPVGPMRIDRTRELVADPIVRAEGLQKRFAAARRNAVDGIDIRVARGTVYGILGPNGAGKSTTIRMLLGLLPPDSGAVRFHLGAAYSDVRERVGYVPQDLALYPRLTARENLRFFGRLYSLPKPLLADRIETLLREVGLSDRGDDSVGDFSTGMMRRLNLAAGLIHSPEMLLLDEPTVGIDPQSRHRIYSVVEQLRRRGITILLTTHYMDEAHRLCDRLAIMDRGRIVLEGAPSELLETYGTYRVELQVTGDEKALEGAAAQLPGVEGVELRQGLLTVRTRGTEGVADVVGAVSKIAASTHARAELKSVRPPDLESLFLDVTGEQLERQG